jgi:hypothetical protein
MNYLRPWKTTYTSPFDRQKTRESSDMVNLYSWNRGTKARRLPDHSVTEHLLGLKRKYPEFVTLTTYIEHLDRAIAEGGVGHCKTGRLLMNIDHRGNVARCTERLDEPVGNILTDVGENFCAANYLVYGEQSVLFEYLHCYGMALCFGLTVFALLEGFDRRLLKLSDTDARCAALGLCHRCIKHADVPCGLQRVFQILIPAAAIVALAPLCVEVVPVSYNTTICGDFYNYSHAAVHQIFEIRYLPVAAAVLLTVSLALLRPQRHNQLLWSKIFFAAGTGAAGFSYLRMILFHAYRENLVWFAAWEEITELLFIAGVGAVLWIFRDGLFRRPPEAALREAATATARTPPGRRSAGA